MRKKLEDFYKVVKKMSWSSKLGFLLWIIGYPISWLGIYLFVLGNHFWGLIIFSLPFVEGNLGIILMGKQGFKAVKRAFFGKN